MGEVRNCPECGKLFIKVRRDLCLDCLKTERQNIDRVREYLKKNKHATMADVVRDVEVSMEFLVYLLDERILILVDNPNFNATCQSCGMPTQNGSLCKDCKDQRIKELADATEAVRLVRQTQQPRKGYYSK